jgi:hypothetical protein
MLKNHKNFLNIFCSPIEKNMRCCSVIVQAGFNEFNHYKTIFLRMIIKL